MSLTDAIPQTIKEIGRIRAGGQAARGQYGQSIADLGQMVSQIPAQMEAKRVAREQEQVRQQQLQIQQGQLKEQQRKQAADDALNTAMSQALTPEGDVDLALLGSHLKGTPGMSEFPALVQHFTAMKTSAAQLKGQQFKNASDEADYMGSLAAGSDAFTSPEDKAGALAAGLASAVKQGLLPPEQAHEILNGMIGDDGAPDPVGVSSTILKLRQTSDAQRKLDDDHARTNALNQASIAQAEETGRKSSEEKAATRLANYSAQLGAATSKTGYAMVYRGVPDDLKDRFDAPEAFDPKTSPQRARFAAMSAKEQQDAIHAIAAERSAEQLRAIEVAREKRLAAGGAEETPAEKRETAAYKQYVSDYEHAQTEARMRSGTTMTIGPDQMPVTTSNAGPYTPPPSLEKWKAMTPSERQAVMTNPNARITDAEMARRSGGGTAPAASSATGVIVTNPTTGQQFRAKDQATADAALKAWADAARQK